jgi:hypothetical protein
LISRTCDCTTKIIRVMFPSGVTMTAGHPGEIGPSRGTPLLPDRVH